MAQGNIEVQLSSTGTDAVLQNFAVIENSAKRLSGVLSNITKGIDLSVFDKMKLDLSGEGVEEFKQQTEELINVILSLSETFADAGKNQRAMSGFSAQNKVFKELTNSVLALSETIGELMAQLRGMGGQSQITIKPIQQLTQAQTKAIAVSVKQALAQKQVAENTGILATATSKAERAQRANITRTRQGISALSSMSSVLMVINPELSGMVSNMRYAGTSFRGFITALANPKFLALGGIMLGVAASIKAITDEFDKAKASALEFQENLNKANRLRRQNEAAAPMRQVQLRREAEGFANIQEQEKALKTRLQDIEAQKKSLEILRKQNVLQKQAINQLTQAEGAWWQVFGNAEQVRKAQEKGILQLSRETRDLLTAAQETGDISLLKGDSKGDISEVLTTALDKTIGAFSGAFGDLLATSEIEKARDLAKQEAEAIRDKIIAQEANIKTLEQEAEFLRSTGREIARQNQQRAVLARAEEAFEAAQERVNKQAQKEHYTESLKKEDTGYLKFLVDSEWQSYQDALNEFESKIKSGNITEDDITGFNKLIKANSDMAALAKQELQSREKKDKTGIAMPDFDSLRRYGGFVGSGMSALTPELIAQKENVKWNKQTAQGVSKLVSRGSTAYFN